MIQSKPRRRAVRIEDSAEWDHLIVRVGGASPLQSAAWGDAKSRQGWRPVRVAAVRDNAVAGAQALWRRTPLGPLLYIPRGPFLTPDADEELLADVLYELDGFAREIGAVALKVEPNAADPGALPRLGFRRSGQSAQPLATLVVDLTPDEASLSARLDRGARYNIGLARRKGGVIQTAGMDACDSFYTLLRETAGRDDFVI
ncbi:MAG: peptidoglycan bridge formation glycyltransferase FemA/FemB family protein, partial [Chloroflexi bacterium]|nr:peptidoglycan bridge formation glycyltransferase FemA/FemB family protein [Chloroflexota bacterium]